MRRLARYLFTLCSALSLLLCVAVCVLWVRSGLGRSDVVTASRGASWSLYSSKGTLCAQQVFRMRGTEGTGGAVTPVSQRWEVGLGGRVYGPGYHRTMDTGTGSRFYGRFSPASVSGPEDAWEQTWVRFVAAPHWLVASAMAVLPAAWLAGAYGRRRSDRRQQSGLCPGCGYDLRASPERCPECGTQASVKQVPDLS